MNKKDKTAPAFPEQTGKVSRHGRQTDLVLAARKI